MKGRGRAFLVIWLLCLAAGIVVGVITGVVVQALNPPPAGDEGNMAYGFYVLFYVLGAVNVTNYAVAVYVGTRYVKREQGAWGHT